MYVNLNFLIILIIAISYKRKRYNSDVIKQSACLASDPITVDHFAYPFNSTPVGRGSDYDGPDSKTIHLDGLGWNFYVCFSAYRGSTGGFLLTILRRWSRC